MTRVRMDLFTSLDGYTPADPTPENPMGEDWGRLVTHYLATRTIELLERYAMVLVTDVDEIVCPVPEFGTLGAYLDRFDEEWVNCLGYELAHRPATEAPLRLDRPILDQRGHWFFNDGYNKAALATTPLSWKPAKVACAVKRAGSAPRSCFCMSVSMMPGATDATRAPCGRACSSSASARAKWSSPAFWAQ